MRLDKYIQDKFNLKSRTYAENLIKTGNVLVDGKAVIKSSADVDESNVIEISDSQNFASQGAYKLEKRLKSGISTLSANVARISVAQTADLPIVF